MAKSKKRRKRKKVLHNTKLLMKNYNSLKLHVDKAIYSLNKIAYDDDQQVVELAVLKRWTEGEERIEFLLEEIGG